MHGEQKLFFFFFMPMFSLFLSIRRCVLLHNATCPGIFRASLNINSTFWVLWNLFSFKNGICSKIYAWWNFEGCIVLNVWKFVSPKQSGRDPWGPTCDSLSSIIPACSPSKLLTRNRPGLVSLSLCAETCSFFSLKAFVTAICKVTDTAVLALLSWTIVPRRLVSCLLQQRESTQPHIFKTMHAAPTDGVGAEHS